MKGTGRTDAWLREQIAIARSMVENVLLALRAIPGAIERGVAVPQLGDGLKLLGQAGSTDFADPGFLDELESAGRLLAEAAAKLAGLGDRPEIRRLGRSIDSALQQVRQCRRCGIELLVQRQDELLRSRVGKPDLHDEQRFVASEGVPSLHRLPLLQLAFLLEAPTETHAALAEEEDDDEDETGSPTTAPADEQPPSASAAGAEALDATALGGSPARERERLSRWPRRELEDHLRWSARDCLSDLAGLSNLRVPLDESSWLTGERFEQRLLASLDALVALGRPAPAVGLPRGWNVLEQAQRFGTESVIPDVGGQFARALSLCCVAGDMGVRAALLALRQVDPKTYPGFRDALSLAPNPAIGSLLTELLGRAEKPIVIVALEVLRFRREATFAALLPLTAHLDPAITGAAARGLGSVDPAPTVIDTLLRMLEEDDDEGVAVDVATSLLQHGLARGLAIARERLRSGVLSERGRLGFLRLVAMAGNASDAKLVHQCLAATPRDAELVGWYGHAGLVPWLLSTLEQANRTREAGAVTPHALEVATARALERITGAGLHDPVEPNVAYDFVHGAALRAEAWKQWWLQHGERFAVGLKHRRGAPFAPRATLDELLGPSIPRDRLEATLELRVVLGPSRFEPGDWVARQRLVLTALGARLGAARSSYPAGQWPADEIVRRDDYLG